jgi:hypothetical protein
MNKENKEQRNGVTDWSKCWICGRTAEQVEKDVRVLIRTSIKNINRDNIDEVQEKHRISINIEPEYVDLNILQKEADRWSRFESKEIAVPLCVVCDAIFSLRSQQTIDSIEEIGYLKDGSICKLVTDELH